MLADLITEIVEDNEKAVGMRFTAENDDEKKAFRTWMDYKNIGTIGSDNKVINVLFTDIDEYLERIEGDQNVGNST